MEALAHLIDFNLHLLSFVFILKIRAEAHQKRFGFDGNQRQRDNDIDDSLNTNLQLKDDLWVDKYRPQKFTQLITMDVIKRASIIRLFNN